MFDNLYDLSNTITAVANRILETATRETTDGRYEADYNIVADLISEEDYNQYFDFIVHELQDTLEVLDIEVDEENHTLDMMCGFAYCPNYEPLPDEDVVSGTRDFRPIPSMAELAQIGWATLKEYSRAPGNHIKPDALGITDAHYEYAVGTFELDASKFPEYTAEPLAAYAPTDSPYEELLLYNKSDTEKKQRPRYEICFDTEGEPVVDTLHEHLQEDVDMLKNAVKEAPVQKVFSRSGAFLQGRPTVVLTFPRFNEHGEANALFHAQTKIMANQLDVALSAFKATISCGHNTYTNSERPADEIVAFVPALADRTARELFERCLSKMIYRLPKSGDMFWVESQYNAFLDMVKEGSAYYLKNCPVGSEERVAVEACAALGRYLGDLQSEFDAARCNHDVKQWNKLSDMADVGNNEDLLERCLRSGAAVVRYEHELQKTLSKYSSLHARMADAEERSEKQLQKKIADQKDRGRD